MSFFQLLTHVQEVSFVRGTAMQVAFPPKMHLSSHVNLSKPPHSRGFSKISLRERTCSLAPSPWLKATATKNSIQRKNCTKLVFMMGYVGHTHNQTRRHDLDYAVLEKIQLEVARVHVLMRLLGWSGYRSVSGGAYLFHPCPLSRSRVSVF